MRLLGLANCRHMKTVRTHLAGLVNQPIVSPDHPTSAWDGLSADEWGKLETDKSVSGSCVGTLV